MEAACVASTASRIVTCVASQGLLAPPPKPSSSARPTVNAVLRRYAEQTIERNPGWFTPRQIRVLRRLIACRTPALGSQAFYCGDCGERKFRYVSCHDRHCSSCGGEDREHWRQRVLAMGLPVQSLHLVFTLPHELNPLLLANSAILIGLFFRCVKNTLTYVLKKDFGCQAGMILVLHTWGQRMNSHFHVHVLLFAGGPSLDETRWIDIPVDVPHPIDPRRLAANFRKRFLRGLRREFKSGNLRLPKTMGRLDDPDKFEAWLAPLSKTPWKVHSQKPPAHCRDATAAIKYLSHYMTGVAISDYRILADDGEYVTIRVKSYRKKCHEEMRMLGTEFVKRYVYHILPERCMRVRYAGFLAGSHREEKLRLCRRLLGATERAEGTEEAEEEGFDGGEEETPDGNADFDRASDVDNRDPRERFPVTCPRCGRSNMTCLGRYDASNTARLIAERRAFWELVHTVASTFDDLPFEYPHELPLPEP